MKNPVIIAFLLFCFNMTNSSGQQYYDFGFEKEYAIEVRDSLGNLYNNPWAGGMNSCHFSSVDLNLDGIKDLFVFDKDGDKVLCYLNNGAPGSVDYTFAPEYKELLPRIKGWANFIDYDCDGRNDLFTYTTGAIMVYRNVSDTVLKFKKAVDKHLLSYQFGGYTNIWVTYADYPAFSDIDNDGDIDILTFGVLGSWLGYHKNLSMEKYGHCDSLDYFLDDYSWGCFAESEESNILTLDTCFDSKSVKYSLNSKVKTGDIKHVGSTLLAIDLDADNDKDLLLGDVDYPNIIQLINGGTPDSAYIISQDTAFPSNDLPVDLVSFPAMCYVDVNNDHKNDLIVSPFDPSLDKSRNFENILLYSNTGANNDPHLVFQRNDFLQFDMIDFGAGAYPVFFDFNKDGLMDIVVSNFGYLDSSYYDAAMALQCVYRSQLALMKNEGSNTNPGFRLITRNYEGISSLKITAAYPAFGDLDGDGDEDMLLGNSKGSVHYFENIAGPGNPVDFILNELNFQGIDVGEYSTPRLVDLNKDNLIDLVCGKKDGKLSYYRNDGTLQNPVFTLQTESLGGVDVTDNQYPYFAYSVPCFFKESNEFRLFVGNVAGHLHYYKDIGNNLNGDFTLDNNNYLWLYEGIRSSVAVHDLNGDGYQDMMMGNYSGGLGYYKGVDPPMIGIENEKSNLSEIDIYPNPANNCIRIYNSTGSEIVKAIIYSINGQKLLIYKIINDQIDISVLTPGLFIVELISKEFTIRRKLVVVSGL